MRGSAGFSLIEMLVALVIMAMAAGLAMLTMGGGMSLSAETDRFVAAMAAARDQSVIENRVVTFEVSVTGYASAVRTRLGPVIPGAAPESWSQGTSVATEGGRLPVVMMFDPIGLTEPVQFTLFRGRASESVSITSSGEIVRVSDAR